MIKLKKWRIVNRSGVATGQGDGVRGKEVGVVIHGQQGEKP